MISLLTELLIFGIAFSTTMPALTGLGIRVNLCNSCQPLRLRVSALKFPPPQGFLPGQTQRRVAGNRPSPVRHQFKAAAGAPVSLAELAPRGHPFPMATTPTTGPVDWTMRSSQPTSCVEKFVKTEMEPARKLARVHSCGKSENPHRSCKRDFPREVQPAGPRRHPQNPWACRRND
jgi:hypothetical protein